MPLFKITGLALLFSACAFFGLFKAEQLRKRAKKLEQLTLSVSKLAEYIRADGGEISRLIPLCFTEDSVFTEKGVPQLDRAYLSKEDAELLTEFFGGLGLRDRQGEYERTTLYASLTEKHYRQADQKANELSRLYSTAGILCGIFLMIFFI